MTSRTTDSHHTPGPWEVLDEHSTRACLQVGAVNRRYGGDEIATLYGSGDDIDFKDAAGIWRGDHTRVANARLIAAAPDLLEACRDLLAAIHAPRYGDDSIWDDLRDYGEKDGGPMGRAFAAITKATGEESDGSSK